MSGLWSLAFGLWSLAFGLWSLAFGLWPLVFGLWSLGEQAIVLRAKTKDRLPSVKYQPHSYTEVILGPLASRIGL
jgi:hypothetical protein